MDIETPISQNPDEGLDPQRLALSEESRRSTYQFLARVWSSEVDLVLWDGLSRGSFCVSTESEAFDSAFRELGEFVSGFSAAEHGRDGASQGHGGLAPTDPSYGSPAFARDARPAVLRTLAADYAVLCRGVDRNRGADPYESVHRNRMGLMMQDEWEDVLKFYRQAGLRLKDTAVESEDHLGYELECMALLCGRSADALSAGPAPDYGAYLAAAALQSQLLCDHLLKWVGSFCKKVRKYASTGFYRSLAMMTEEFLRMDEENLLATIEAVTRIQGSDVRSCDTGGCADGPDPEDELGEHGAEVHR